jgi:hypothetical protein
VRFCFSVTDTLLERIDMDSLKGPATKGSWGQVSLDLAEQGVNVI